MRLPNALAVLICTAGSVLAQSPCELTKLTASDPDDDDRFGFAVAIDAGRAAVGAFKHDDQGINSGSVYVFLQTGTSWAQEAELLPVDGQSSDRFGWDVGSTLR